MESSAAERIEAVPGSHPQRIGRASLPSQRTLLTWLFVGRLVLALAALLGASLIWTRRPDVSFISSIAVVFALTLTAYGAWMVFVRRAIPSRAFLQIQALVDLGLVTALVQLSGEPKSAFPALYVLVVAAYTMLLPLGAGVFTALAASLMFLADVVWGQAMPPDTAFWIQFAVFNVVFLLVALLSHRLREAGAEQASLEERFISRPTTGLVGLFNLAPQTPADRVPLRQPSDLKCALEGGPTHSISALVTPVTDPPKRGRADARWD